VKRVVIIDHHKTSFELFDRLTVDNAVPNNVEVNLRMDKSGASLAWEYFNKEKVLVKDEDARKYDIPYFQVVTHSENWKRYIPI
jgi:hypothetical protein